MKTIIIRTLLIFSFSFIQIFAQEWEWAIGGKGYDSFDYSNAVVVDNSGNVYIAGYFQSSTISFGNVKINNYGGEDIFVAKFDNNGTCIWAQSFGGVENDRATCLALYGNFLLVGGSFESKPAKFGNFNLNSTLGSDIFIATLNLNDGNVVGVKSFEGNNYEQIYNIFVDDSSNIFICGDFSGDSLILDTIVLRNFNYNTSIKGMDDGFLAKISPNGKTIWAKAIGRVGNDRVNDVLVDKEGMVYIYGTFNSNFLVFQDTMLNKGYSDIFLVKYDPYNNRYLWQIKISGEDKEYPASMTFGTGNNIYITGEFQSSNLKFGGIELANSGSYDFYLAKIDVDGNILKLCSFGSYADEYAKKIVADKNGNIYIGGYFASPSLVLDNITLLNSTSDNYSDIFTAKFDAELNAIWGKTAGGKGEDQSFSIANDNFGNIFQTGNFNSREIFFNKKSIYNYGHSNIFLSKLNPIIPSEVEKCCTPDSEIIIYPNPCENFIIIEIDKQITPIKCDVLNYLGEKIREIKLINKSVFETKELPKGLYFLRFSNKVIPFQKL